MLPPIVAALLLTAIDALLTLRALPSAARAPGFEWLLTLLALAGPVLEIPLILVLPRFGAQRFAVAAGIVAALSAVGSAAGGDPTLFIAFRTLGFVAHTVLVPALAWTIAEWSPARSRTGMFAWLTAALTLGPVLGTLLWNTASPYLPGPAAFTFAAAAWIAIAGWLWWAIPNRAGYAAWLDRDAAQALTQTLDRSRQTESRAPLRPTFRDTRLLLLAVIALTLGVSASSAGQWIGVLFRDLSQRVTFDLVLAALAAAAGLVWAFALDRSGRVATGVVMATGLAALGLAASVMSGPSWQTMAGLAAHAAALAATRAMLLSLAARLGRTGSATAFAIIDAAGRAGMLVGPLILVWLARSTGALQTALLGIAVLLGAGFAAAVTLRSLSDWD